MNSWDPKQLWLKAKRFADIASESDQTSPEYAFHSALALECLARAALTHVHPALNADPRDDTAILYGCGIEVTGSPRSLPAHSVYLRLTKIVEGFGQPQLKLCEFVALQRNAYLHTSELPYDNLSPNKWLPRYYETAKILNEHIGKTLADYVGNETAAAATELIASLNEAGKKAALKKIAICRQVWEKMQDADKLYHKNTATVATARLAFGEAVAICPSCGCKGTLNGDAIRDFPERYENGELLMDVEFLSTGFKCVGCGLVLKGVEEIAHAELNSHFVEVTSTNLHDLYQPEYEREYDNM